jgi:short-subunit dehydrogenase
MTFDRKTDRVVVITGASSGIGRATAEAFAETGARLVLAARGEAALAEVAARCRQAGAEVLVVATDVTEPDALEHLALEAVARFDVIDIWINNAGIGAVGAFDGTPMAAHEQVVATDLVGYMRGAHAVLPHFKARRRGTLINVLSLGSWAPTPYAAAYSAAKFGLRGFTNALRGELSAWRDIHVCDVHPSFVDTPGMQHGGNYVGRELKPPPGVLGVDAVARAIVALAERPRRQVVVGRGVTALARSARFLAPGRPWRPWPGCWKSISRSGVGLRAARETSSRHREISARAAAGVGRSCASARPWRSARPSCSPASGWRGRASGRFEGRGWSKAFPSSPRAMDRRPGRCSVGPTPRPTAPGSA